MQENHHQYQADIVKNIKESEKYENFLKVHLQPKTEREQKAKELLLEYRGKYTEEILNRVAQ
jgi:hypothetical protein